MSTVTAANATLVSTPRTPRLYNATDFSARLAFGFFTFGSSDESTLLRSAPHPRQNFPSSTFCTPHFGQNIPSNTIWSGKGSDRFPSPSRSQRDLSYTHRMNQFAEWYSFYLIVGGAAGALIGLQFVVMTLIASRGETNAPADAGKAFSTPTVVHFTTVLFIAALVRAP